MTNDIMIQVDHITKKFGKLKAVDDVSLTLKKGEIVCLIGPSGSGKSTVLRCIDHLEKPEAGSIYIDGALLKEGTPEYNKLRSKMGFVFQHFNLFPNMTVLENLTLAPLKVMGMTEEEFNKQVKAAVKDTMKQNMVTEAIADKENIKMSKKDYNKELKAIAKSYGYSSNVDALKKAFEEQDLKDAALKNMVKEWLGKNCVQVAKKSSDSKSSSDSSSSSN